MDKPLEGLRVVELGTYVAVPKAARIMADWGAEVIKVEPPGGDAWRGNGAKWQLPCEEDYNPLFQPENAGKKSLVLNLKAEAGKAVLRKLLATADIFLTNTRPAALEKLGFGYEALRAQFPALIFARFNGYGFEGPDRDRPGFDLSAFWARSGVLVGWATAEGAPNKPVAGFGDGAAGALLLAAILAALYRRGRTGQGGQVDLSLYGSALWFASGTVVMAQEKFGHVFPKSRFEGNSPIAPLYQTQDGDWILLSEPDWDSRSDLYFELLGIPEYKGNADYGTYAGTRKHMPEVVALLDEAIGRMPTAKLVAELDRIDAIYEVLAHPADVLRDPQAWENGFLEEVALENGDTVVLPTVPVQFDGTAREKAALAPQFGANSAQILREIGYGEGEITQLVADGVVLAKG